MVPVTPLVLAQVILCSNILIRRRTVDDTDANSGQMSPEDYCV